MMHNHKTYNALIEYVTDLSPNLHLTLQWDKNHRTSNLQLLEQRLYFFMSRIERELLGRKWYTDHIRFVAFAETNYVGEYHIHVLINDMNHSIENWEKVITKITDRTKRTPIPKEPYFQLITPGEEINVIKYDLKQFCPDFMGRIDTTRFIPSEYLFNISKQP